jgi:hypothetical protein
MARIADVPPDIRGKRRLGIGLALRPFATPAP